MKKYNIFIPLVVFSVLLYSGCSEEEDPTQIKLSGNLEAISVTVSSQLPGLITEFPYEEGDEVKENDTLVKIDDSNLLLQLNKAYAGIGVLDAQYSLLRNGARKEDINQAQEMVNQLETNLSAAETDFARVASLYDKGTFTKKQYDDAETRVKVIKSQLEAAKENLAKVKTIVRPEELQTAAARKKEAEAGIEVIKNSIQKCYIVSPITGRIVKKHIRKGETAGALTSLAKIAATDELDLVVYVGEKDLGKIKVGQEANITIDSNPGKTYPGKITFISPEASFTPKNIQTSDERTRLVYEVKIRVKNTNNELKDGMPADASIKLNK